MTDDRPGPTLRFLGFIYTQNPFYVISAALILFGLNEAFGGGAAPINRWLLLGLLEGYTVLMAVAAVLIVRVGKVWDDARSVLLILVLLFLATTVAADPLIEDDPAAGALVLGAALAVAALVSEGVLRATGIRLPLAYRLPYHALLALFHLYPLLLSRLLERSHGGQLTGLSVGLFLFPVAGAVVLTSLVVALRRGRRAVEGNAAPWPWPWFPWSVFGLLAVALGVRTYLFGASLFPGPGGSNPVGPFLYAPLVLAAAFLLLSAPGTDPTRRRLALCLPLGAIALAFCTGRGAVEREFLASLVGAVGGPVLWAAVGAVLVHAYALLRRVDGAEIWLVSSLGLLASIGPETVGLRSLTPPQAAPLGLLTALLIAGAVRRPASWRSFLALAAGVATLSLAAPVGFLGLYGAAPIHLLVLGALAIAGFQDDDFAPFLESAGAIVTGALYLLVLASGGGWLPEGVAALRPVYLVSMVAISLAYSTWTGSRLFLGLAFLQAGLGCWRGAAAGARAVERIEIPPGLALLFWGMVSFALAAVISLAKSGRLRRHRTGRG